MKKSNKGNEFVGLTAEEILESFPLPFYILYEDGEIIHCNQAALKFYGYKKKEEILGLKPYALSPDNQSDGTSSDIKGREMISKAINAGYHRFRWVHKKKNGRTFLAEVELITKKGLIFATVKDIDCAEKIKQNKARIMREMRKLANTDYLTGLYNKRFFIVQLDKLIKLKCSSNEKVAVLFIDFDNLKEINDTFGHALGDKTIIEAARRLKGTAPRSSLLARFGGDEFVLAVSFTGTKEEINQLSQRLLNKLNVICRIENHEFYIPASIGIACCPEDGNDAETLLKKADIAMYHAKKEKYFENSVVFYNPEMGQKIQERFLLENHLRKAIEEKELNIYLQPIFNIAENRITSAEALLRWDSKVFGQVPPSVFIELAEETGIIYELGKYVLHEVCRYLQSEKTKQSKLVPIAVNISLKQMENSYFSTEVKQMLSYYEIEGENFEFEITERVSAGNIETVSRNLKEIKKLGIKVAMDDFGTGFSSLSMMLNLEIDKIKIDRMFIKNIGRSRDEKIIKTMVSMAKKLELGIVAEGVEREEEIMFLKKINCECGQGYYWARPMPIDDFSCLLSWENNEK